MRGGGFDYKKENGGVIFTILSYYSWLCGKANRFSPLIRLDGIELFIRYDVHRHCLFDYVQAIKSRCKCHIDHVHVLADNANECIHVNEGFFRDVICCEMMPKVIFITIDGCLFNGYYDAAVTQKTVKRICNRLKLKMEKEEIARHRSEAQIKVLKCEKRRLVFGLEQRTDRRIGQDKARTKVLDLLARHGYITIKGSRNAYYSEDMRRAEHIESYAVSVGVDIEPWETD